MEKYLIHNLHDHLFYIMEDGGKVFKECCDIIYNSLKNCERAIIENTFDILAASYFQDDSCYGVLNFVKVIKLKAQLNLPQLETGLFGILNNNQFFVIVNDLIVCQNGDSYLIEEILDKLIALIRADSFNHAKAIYQNQIERKIIWEREK